MKREQRFFIFDETRTNRLSIGEHRRIISIRYDQNISSFAIAVKIDCTVRNVHNIVRLYDETGDVVERRAVVVGH